MFSKLSLYIQTDESLLHNTDEFILKNNNSDSLTGLFTLNFKSTDLTDNTETITYFEANDAKFRKTCCEDQTIK